MVFGMAIMLRNYSSKLDVYKKDLVTVSERYESTLTIVNQQLESIKLINEIIHNEENEQNEIREKNQVRIGQIQSDIKNTLCSSEWVDDSIADRLREHAGEIH